MTAVDFSFQKPSIAQLQGAGVTAVGRYLTGPGKAIDGTEFQSYLAAGISVWFVFENDENDADGGFNAGTAAAVDANTALAGLGLPASCPVYFAADKEYLSYLPTDYWRGAASIRPPQTNGGYGQGSLLNALLSNSLALFFWMSDSDSFPGNGPGGSPILNLHQRPDGAPLPGTDLNLVCKPDFGQWPRPSTPLPPEAEDMDVPTFVRWAFLNYLVREPTSAEYGAWVTWLTNTPTYVRGDMIAYLVDQTPRGQAVLVSNQRLLGPLPA